MNKAVTKRIISKQESTVLLGDLDLFHCTETIEVVSISNYKSVRLKNDMGKAKKKTFIVEYMTRLPEFEDYSLHLYFHITRNGEDKKRLYLPHFVGINGIPKYPVTDDYARHVLIVHKPWREYPSKLNWKKEFEKFINSNICPISAKMDYERVMSRYVDKMTSYEPKACNGTHDKNQVREEDEELMWLVGMKGADEFKDFDDCLLEKMPKGETFDWGKKPKVCICCRV